MRYENSNEIDGKVIKQSDLPPIMLAFNHGIQIPPCLIICADLISVQSDFFLRYGRIKFP